MLVAGCQGQTLLMAAEMQSFQTGVDCGSLKPESETRGKQGLLRIKCAETWTVILLGYRGMTADWLRQRGRKDEGSDIRYSICEEWGQHVQVQRNS